MSRFRLSVSGGRLGWLLSVGRFGWWLGFGCVYGFGYWWWFGCIGMNPRIRYVGCNLCS